MIFSEKFTTKWHDTDAFRRVRPTQMLVYMQEVSNHHMSACGISLDELRDKIKLNHVLRLQKNECTIEHGFVLSDLLNNFERVSDHCSNVAGCVIEMAKEGTLDMHKYTEETIESVEYKQKVVYYQQKYSI